MIAANYTTVRNRFKDYCDRVIDEEETLVVTRKDEKNVVILSAERYNAMEKALRDVDFLKKIELGRLQVSAGLGIVKTIEELEAMANDD